MKKRLSVLFLETKQPKRLPRRSARDQDKLLGRVAQRVHGHARQALLNGLGGHAGSGGPAGASIGRSGDLGRIVWANPSPNRVRPGRRARFEARNSGGECLFSVVLEVGESGLEVGFEERWVVVGVEERELGELVEERRAIVLEGGESLVEVHGLGLGLGLVLFGS